LAELFLRAGLRADDFFAVFRRVAVAFVVRRFRVAAAFFPAAERFAVVRFRVAAAFFPAALRLVAGRFRVTVFRAAIPVPLSFVGSEGSCVTTPSV
jgi:hypothetical protein